MIGGLQRLFAAAGVSLMIVGTAVGSVWLLASSGVFDIENDSLPGAPIVNPTIVADVTLPPGAGRVQVNPPRDPFTPLVTTTTSADDTSTTTTGDGTTSTTAGDGSTTTTSGSTTTTAGGSTTTTTSGDQPDEIRVTLIEVRGAAGSREAVVEVDSVTYTVEVGETFATDFKVISLTSNGGVFEYKGQAFSLTEGQAILK